jgi:hypothetical protein
MQVHLHPPSSTRGLPRAAGHRTQPTFAFRAGAVKRLELSRSRLLTNVRQRRQRSALQTLRSGLLICQRGLPAVSMHPTTGFRSAPSATPKLQHAALQMDSRTTASAKPYPTQCPQHRYRPSSFVWRRAVLATVAAVSRSSTPGSGVRFVTTAGTTRTQMWFVRSSAAQAAPEYRASGEEAAKSGWTTSRARGRRHLSQHARTLAGEVTTAVTLKTRAYAALWRLNHAATLSRAMETSLALD